MTDTLALSTELAYYAANGAALFPIPAGSKAPYGIVASFKHDYSSDPAQWASWQTAHPGCNFGVVAFASGLVICDIDTSGPDGRAEAWQLWCDLCAAWGIPTAAPHVQSARGGWHCYFQVPPTVDAATLRQPDAIKKRINVRCLGYTVAAGSYWTDEAGQSLPYILLPDAAPPHPAPDALIAHCTRAAPRPLSIGVTGSRDRGDVAALLVWLNDHGAFEAYEDWCGAGMALRLEFGDPGIDLWELTHDNTVTPSEAATKWESFATEPTADSVTLNSLLDRAHRLGWHGTVRKSSASMFDGVAQLAAATGASLSSNRPMPSPDPGVPMMAGQAELARLAAPILADFLDATKDASASGSTDFPTLPVAMSGHGLYESMGASLLRIAALCEGKWKPARVTDALAVLNILHMDVFEAVCRRVRAAGHTLQDKKIRLSAANLSEKVERLTVTHDKWEYDKNGEPQSDNSDNVAVLLGVLSLEIRWNAWTERMEIQGGIDSDLRWPVWSYVDDTVVAKLRTRANRTKTRFRPAKEFLWETLLALAHANTVDPVLETLDALAGEWDGVPRLSGWLPRYCRTPDDAYHQAVGNLLLGGMVKRARHPGCKFDFMPIFAGSQGTGKSTMAAIVADMGATPLHEIILGKGANFTDNVMLGDASKELILALGGKMVAEIGEMGTRNSANVSHVKAMLSRQVDEGRTAYARAVSQRPRRNVFWGTTNEDSALTDTTGNRRFLPIHITAEIDLTGLHADVRQLIGEAAHMEAAGATFDLPRDVWSVAGEHQEAARSMSDMEVLMTDWFAETDFTRAAFVTTADLVELASMHGWKNVQGLRSGIMKRLGFRDESFYLVGRKTRGWVRGEIRAPREVEKLTRYTVSRDVRDGRVKVGITMARQAVSVPLSPLPY